MKTLGMTQVEAMSLGIPVVASDLPGVRVPIQKTGMGILVPAKNTKILGEKIVECIRNKSNYLKKKEKVFIEFSLSDTLESYNELIKKG